MRAGKGEKVGVKGLFYVFLSNIDRFSVKIFKLV